MGSWEDPAQVTVTLVDVTDKTDPSWVDSWYDADHPSGPHNLYTHMIDNEWYIFVANPDYESCDVGQGDACGGITLAHLNFAGYGDLPRIVKVGEAEVSWESTLGGWIYIHDMTVQTWPGEEQNDPRFGRTYSYGAYWEAGLRIFDISDVPHPTNSPAEYAWHGTTCRLAGGTQAACKWQAVVTLGIVSRIQDRADRAGYRRLVTMSAAPSIHRASIHASAAADAAQNLLKRATQQLASSIIQQHHMEGLRTVDIILSPRTSGQCCIS